MTPRYLEVWYEELYTADIAANRDAAKRVFQFLGLGMPTSPEVDTHLDPSRSKINSPQRYALLPNVEEINRLFGSDKTGWLFGDDI